MRSAPPAVRPPRVRLWIALALVLAVAGIASPVRADRYKLAQTYAGVDGNWSFGSAIASDAERVYVAAQYERVADSQLAGAVHIFDAATGTFLRRLRVRRT